jgi:hypothetical protein
MCPPLPQADEGDAWLGELPFAPTTLSHAEIVQGEPPFAPTPPILWARGWG